MTNQSEDQDNDASKPVNHKLVTTAAYNLIFHTWLALPLQDNDIQEYFWHSWFCEFYSKCFDWKSRFFKQIRVHCWNPNLPF